MSLRYQRKILSFHLNRTVLLQVLRRQHDRLHRRDGGRLHSRRRLLRPRPQRRQRRPAQRRRPQILDGKLREDPVLGLDLLPELFRLPLRLVSHRNSLRPRRDPLAVVPIHLLPRVPWS